MSDCYFIVPVNKVVVVNGVESAAGCPGLSLLYSTTGGPLHPSLHVVFPPPQMSQQEESEEDIWNYKPLRKKRKGTAEGPRTTGDGAPTSKKRRTVNDDSKKRKSVKNNDSNNNDSSSGKTSAVKPSQAVQVDKDLTTGRVNITNGCTGELSAGASQPDGGEGSGGDRWCQPGGGASDRWCPICQMPFSILVVQSRRWHVSECLDAAREDHRKECPDGFQCTSTIPSHYRRFSHTVLAHSRASGDPVHLLEGQRQTPAQSSLGGLSGPTDPATVLDSSQDIAVSLSSQPDLAASPVGGSLPATPTNKVATNSLLLLRSPGPKDLKKRKGWSTTGRATNKSSQEGKKTQVSSTPAASPRAGGGSQDSQDAVVKTEFTPQENGLKTDRTPQESVIKTEFSPEETDVKTDFSSQESFIKTDFSPQETDVKTDFSPRRGFVKTDCSPQGGFIKADLSPDDDDDEISYSPLSKFPEEEEEEENEVVGVSNPRSEADEDSLMLFSDDELFGAFADDLEDGTEASAVPEDSQVDQIPGNSSGPGNGGPDSTAAAYAPSSREKTQTQEKAPSSREKTQTQEKAPSSREKTQTQEKAPSSSREKTQTQEKAPTSSCLRSPQSEVLDRLRQTLSGSIDVPRGALDDPTGDLSSSQSSLSQPSQSVATAPRAGQGKAGHGGAAMKQTDIGVFFGLKPLKKKEKEQKVESATQSSPSAESSSQKRGEWRGGKGRRSWTVTSEVPSPARGGGDTGTTGPGQAASAGGGAGRGGRPAGRRGGRGGRGGSRWSRDGEPGESRRCPFYKKIPGTKFAIDAFSYGEVEGISAYFLTHFHSDHYGGLRKTSTLPIYCNRITGNLVMTKLGVAERYVHILPMNVQVTVEGVRVTLLDANHCPGSAMLLFMLPDGQTVLHTGDFRADPSMEKYPEILSCRVQTLYLDTTYCSPEYTFPAQDRVISFAANTTFEAVTLAPRTLVVCGSYSVGKEKVFLALAEVLGSKVCLSRDKYNTMCCLESDRIRELITTDWKAAQVHVLPMMKINYKHLKDHLNRFSAQYDQLLAFKPTGWTFSQQLDNVEDIQPQRSGNITTYGVPYSEHSSFMEMKRFVQWLRPLKVIPTVNVGSYASRRAMETCFSEWLKEARDT